MTRKTVTIKMQNEATERHFHLAADKAERFAAQVRSEGGTATVGPLVIGTETNALLSRLGVSVR